MSEDNNGLNSGSALGQVLIECGLTQTDLELEVNEAEQQNFVTLQNVAIEGEQVRK